MSAIVYIIGLLAFLLLLNLALIIWIVRLSRHYNALTKGTGQKPLMQALEGLQKTLSQHERSLAIHQKSLVALEISGHKHLQRLGLKRFNPFSDTGGDQSFILTILDGNKDGVVITSLHSRENTRFYIKEVKEGKGRTHALSTQEQQLI